MRRGGSPEAYLFPATVLLLFGQAPCLSDALSSSNESSGSQSNFGRVITWLLVSCEQI